MAVAKTRVFISYSRKESEFAEGLKNRLEEDGFDAFMDVEDIVKGEPWKERLKQLIEGADVLVFLVSPNSVQSEYCIWEVDCSEELAKRILPVICKETGGELVPSNLKRLNWTFLETEEKWADEYPKLVASLREDARLVRKHTDLAKRANSWKRSNGSLLRGKELEDAETWRDEVATTPTQPTELHLEYINASRRAAQNWLRTKIWLSTTAAIVAVTLTVIAYWQRNEALENQALTQWKTGILYRDELGLATVAAQWFAQAANSPDSALADSARLAATQAVRGVSLQEKSPPESAMACAEFPSTCLDGEAKESFGADTINFTLNEEKGYAISWHRDFSVKAWKVSATPFSVAPLDCETGAAPIRHDGRVSGALLDWESNRLVSWSEDNSMRAWNVCSHAELDRFMHENPILGAALIPATGEILTWSTDNNIRVWELGDPLPRIIGSHDDEILGAAYSPPGRVVSWGRDGTVRFWDLLNGIPALSELHDANEVRKVKIDGQQIVSLNRDMSVSRWQVDDGAGSTSFEQVISVPLPHGSTDVLGARFDGAGDKILSWDEDGYARLWKKTGGFWQEPVEIPEAELSLSGTEVYFDASLIRGAEFFSNGSQLVTWGEENILIWDTADSPRICLGTYFDTDNEMYEDFLAEGTALSHDRKHLVGWAYGGEIWMCKLGPCPAGYPTGEGESIEEMACGDIRKQHTQRVRGAAFNADSTRVLSWDEGGTILISEVNPSGLDFDLHLKARISERAITTALFSPDEKRILASVTGGDVILCDIPGPDETGMACRSKSFGNEVYSLQFDEEGQLAMGITSLGDIVLIDVGKWKKLPQMTHATDSSKGMEPGVQFDQSGFRILSWSNAGEIGLWDTSTGDPVIAGLFHGEGLREAQFDREGRQVLSWGGEGRGVRVWNLAYQNGQSAYMMQQAIAAKTGTGMNDAGELQTLDADRWAELREALNCKTDAQ